MPFRRATVLLLLAAAIAPAVGHAQSVEQAYSKRDVMIPMRDGVRMHTEIYAPREQAGALPIIFLRTPYRASDPAGGYTPYFDNAFRELAKDGYIFVVQDARGRFGSEGEFEWNRPVRHRWDPDAVDASTDAYDAIDWLVENVPDNNGRVGMLGVSYPGWYTTMALVDPHPALRAASPQASPSDYFMGDDFYHNGAFRLAPSAELPYLFDFDPKANSPFPYDQVDTWEFFLDLGPIRNMNARYLHDVSPTWNNFLAHATYDEFWERGNTLQHLDEVSVPTLNVVGWWDAENLGGALDIYDRMEPLDERGINHLVVGPWSHGQWDNAEARGLGAYNYGSETAGWYQREIQSPWFAHWLKDAPAPGLAEAVIFQTGSNEWKTYAAWPPASLTETRALYFQPGGGLSWTAPDDDGADRYAAWVSDPANPVPYSRRPIMGFWQGLADIPLAAGRDVDARFGNIGALWKVEDQRFAHGRPDVLSFVTEPLEQDLEVAGRIRVRLHASTTGTDADWVVKLIDVYPEAYPQDPEMGGYQLMVADDVLRGKFRESFAEPAPLVPGEPAEFVIDLRTRNHMFRRGHRVMVQVQSTWFPLIDRNPQVFMDIPTADAEDFRAAEHRVWFSRSHASRVELPVVRR